MRTLKIFLSFLFVLFLQNNMYCQELENSQQNKKFSDRLFTGGNLGAQFGSISLIDISPILGVMITKHLATGIGITYQYYSDKRFTPKISTSQYGGRVFGRFYIPILNDGIFVHLEYEFLNYEKIFIDYSTGLIKSRERSWLHSPLAGAGYRQFVGRSVYIELAVLWNLNDTPESPYQNPIIRMGVNFGL